MMPPRGPTQKLLSGQASPAHLMKATSHMTNLTDRFSDALTHAAFIHRTQTRKGKPTPYIAHLLSVAALVIEDGGDEDEAIAALLHDVLEDQSEKISAEEIGQRYGSRVRAIVEGCSDTPAGYAGGAKPPWQERKEAYLRHLQECDLGNLRVSMADKLHNARDLLADYRVEGDDVWSRFSAGKDDQLWNYRSLVEAFRRRGLGGKMFGEFERVVEELESVARGA